MKPNNDSNQHNDTTMGKITDKTVLLEAVGVTKKFANKSSASSAGVSLSILDSLNVKIHKGETVAIVGVSGSGKSTLLSLLAGLDLPDSGEISIDGVDITKLNEAARSIMRANKLAFVFQDFMLLPHLTALENVMLPLEMRGVKDAASRASEELKKVGLEERQNHYPSQLSGGEQQRTALARAFAARPLLLFADEPSGNLDLATGGQISSLMFNLNKESETTLLLVTHDMKLAAMCDSVYELKEGKLAKISINNQVAS